MTKAPARLLGAVDLLFDTPVLTIPQAAERLGVGYNTAQRYVERLEQEGMVSQRVERDYGKTFYAMDIIRVVSQPSASPTPPPRETGAA